MLAMIEEITAVTSAMKWQKVTGNKYDQQSDVNSPSCWPVIQDHNGRVYNGLRGQLTRVQISSLIQLAVTDLF